MFSMLSMRRATAPGIVVLLASVAAAPVGVALVNAAALTPAPVVVVPVVVVPVVVSVAAVSVAVLPAVAASVAAAPLVPAPVDRAGGAWRSARIKSAARRAAAVGDRKSDASSDGARDDEAGASYREDEASPQAVHAQSPVALITAATIADLITCCFGMCSVIFPCFGR
ncbi:hypothetical protein [Burkholderia sp. L27(2015)]|uniref:hypothetical protein n=1 Tax=Burkholderia sp. L27(2015) TaxID=1641858 RepID=UPI0020B1518C|nr:hypothetical protein [Burkholderia sp. L27(2015)]